MAPVMTQNAREASKSALNMSPMLSVVDVAEMLNVSTDTVYRLKDQLNGPRAYRIGRCIRFKPEDIIKYLASREVQQVQPRKQGYCKIRFNYVPGMRIV